VRPVPGPILIAYDGSEPARHAIAEAGRLLAPRSAIVVFVWDPVPPVPPGDPFGLTTPIYDPVQMDEVNDAVRTNAEAIAEDGARRAREAGFEAEGVAEETRGSSATTIVELADERGVEAIVAGARWHSGVRSLLLGSVSNAVVHHAKVPTLVVPPPGAGDADAG
jgi:nucleotide-binding universal stress UspA family protein